MRRRRLILLSLLASTASLPVPLHASAAPTRTCAAVKNPYPGTRYAGVSLSHITATGVTCTTARRVARGAHRKALGLTPDEDGVRVLSWGGWRVVGDLKGSSDRYTATKRGDVVRWRF